MSNNLHFEKDEWILISEALNILPNPSNRSKDMTRKINDSLSKKGNPVPSLEENFEQYSNRFLFKDKNLDKKKMIEFAQFVLSQNGVETDKERLKKDLHRLQSIRKNKGMQYSPILKAKCINASQSLFKNKIYVVLSLGAQWRPHMDWTKHEYSYLDLYGVINDNNHYIEVSMKRFKPVRQSEL